MAIVRYKGKTVNYKAHRAYKVKKHARGIQRANVNGLLPSLQHFLTSVITLLFAALMLYKPQTDKTTRPATKDGYATAVEPAMQARQSLATS